MYHVNFWMRSIIHGIQQDVKWCTTIPLRWYAIATTWQVLELCSGLLLVLLQVLGKLTTLLLFISYYFSDTIFDVVETLGMQGALCLDCLKNQLLSYSLQSYLWFMVYALSLHGSMILEGILYLYYLPVLLFLSLCIFFFDYHSRTLMKWISQNLLKWWWILFLPTWMIVSLLLQLLLHQHHLSYLEKMGKNSRQVSTILNWLFLFLSQKCL